MKAIMINCKETDFIELILRNEKQAETRSKNVFKSLFDPYSYEEKVALIKTGKGKATVEGYATIRPGTFCKKLTLEFLEGILKIKGTKYECKEQPGKWMYRLKNVERCTPYKLPENIVNHGRSWCEF